MIILFLLCYEKTFPTLPFILVRRAWVRLGLYHVVCYDIKAFFLRLLQYLHYTNVHLLDSETSKTFPFKLLRVNSRLLF